MFFAHFFLCVMALAWEDLTVNGSAKREARREQCDETYWRDLTSKKSTACNEGRDMSQAKILVAARIWGVVKIQRIRRRVPELPMLGLDGDDAMPIASPVTTPPSLIVPLHAKWRIRSSTTLRYSTCHFVS